MWWKEKRETKLQMSLDQREDQCRAVSMLPTAGAIAAGFLVAGEVVVDVAAAEGARHVPVIARSNSREVREVLLLLTGEVDVVAGPSGDATTTEAPRAAALTANAAPLAVRRAKKEARGNRAAGGPVVAITGATMDPEVDSEAVAAEAEVEGVSEEDVEEAGEADAPRRKTKVEIVVMLPPAEM